MPKGSYQFLFCQFLFHWFLFHFLFCCDLFALTLGGSPLHDTKGSPQIFLPPIFIPLILFCFLFCCDLFALTLGESPPPDAQGSSQIFILPVYILLIFILFFIPLWPFCTDTWRVPTTWCPRVPTNFYSTVTFLYLHLESLHHLMSKGPHHFLFHFLFSCDLFVLTLGWSPPPNVWESSPIFILPFILRIFYSTFYSTVTFLHLHLDGPYHLMSKDLHQFLFCLVFCWFLFHFLFHCDLFGLEVSWPHFIPIFIPLWPFYTYTYFYTAVTFLHLQLCGGSPSPSNIICNVYYHSEHSKPRFQPIPIIPSTKIHFLALFKLRFQI